MSKEGSSEEVPQDGAAGGGETLKKDGNADIYENHGSKKIVRLITVMAYVFSVSFVAIVLSAYYLFLWEPPNPRLLRRPVHLSSEPEVQFLLSDQPIVIDEFKEHGQNSDASRPPFSSRIADMDGLANTYDPMGNNREKFDESLFLLRNSLIQFRRNKANDSKSTEKNFSRKNWRISDSFNGTSLEKGKASNWTESSTGKDSKHSTRAMESTFENSGISLTLDSSTISGDEANNNRFTSTRNNSVPELPKKDSRPNRNSTENMLVSRNKYKNKVPIDLTAKVRILNKKMRSSDEEYLNDTKNTMNQEPSFIIRISDEESVESQENGKGDAYQIDKFKDTVNKTDESATNNQRSYESPVKLWNVALTLKGDERKDKLYEPKHKQKLVRVLTVVAYVIFVSMAAILLSLYYTFLWDPKDVSVRMRVKPECTDMKLSYSLAAPPLVNETHLEKTTSQSVTMLNEQSTSPETTTIQKQKDFLSVLTKIAHTSVNTSSRIKVEDLPINSSRGNREMSTRMHSNIN